jgi:hypothetical protein
MIAAGIELETDQVVADAATSATRYTFLVATAN